MTLGFLRLRIETRAPACNALAEPHLRILADLGAVLNGSTERGARAIDGSTVTLAAWQDQAVTPKMHYRNIAKTL